MTHTAYAFDNSATEAADQHTILAEFLDPITTTRIDYLELRTGTRVWELGAGGGSIAACLANHVGPTGHVVATDINTDRLQHLDKLGNVTVVEHDIRTMSTPDGDGPYDLIHARLVLLHLPQRREILRWLVSQLATGGWLLLEEFDCTRPLHVYTSRSPADSELFLRVTGAIIDILRSNGADMGWAHDTHAAMLADGLSDVQTITHSQSWTGGSTGARLHACNSQQLADTLDARGFTPSELERFRAILADPAHSAESYRLVSTRGRRPDPELP